MKKAIFFTVCSTILVLFSAVDSLAQKDSNLHLFRQKKIDSASLAKAVNHFIEIGETASVTELKAIASRDFASSEIDITFRVACVCRILWKNDVSPIAPPQLGMYGGGISVNRNKPKELMKWPKYPVAKSGKSYFIVVHRGRGGTGPGPTGGIGRYIDGCKAKGTFLETPILVPNTQQARVDLETLFRSERWKQTKGNDQSTRRALLAQIPNG